MNKKFNRKKLFSIEKNFLYIFFLFFFIFVIFFYIYTNYNKIHKLLILNIEKLSFNFDYTLQNYKIDGLNNISDEDIVRIIQPYMNTSIFLLPLKKISNSIIDNNWVETVKLKIDYKNKIFIEISEFNPIGVYYFNDNKYYFDSNGKIIDYVNSKNYNKSKFITFTGQSSTINAYFLLNILDKVKKDFQKEILQANFIENRRWDLLLEGNLLLKLSEKNLKKSIENYFKLKNNLSYNELIDIRTIDLRDFQKAIIEYK